MIRKSLVTVLLLLAAALAHADEQFQRFVDATVSAARDKARLPAVAALVQIKGRIEAQTAIGVRGVGNPEPATVVDRWHIGSDTRAMTATLIARLVERRALRFEDTLAQLFPGLAANMDPQMRAVTLTQLLTHTAGLPALASPEEIAAFDAVIASIKGVRAQRAALAAYYLRRPPTSKVGEFAASNLGYIIAGAVAESRSDQSWEDQLRTEVWKPLRITQAGFGAPGKAGRVDQPLGHMMAGYDWRAVDPANAQSDNPIASGPAGTVNITLQDWVLFAQDQLDGLRGDGKLLKPETYGVMQTPVQNRYAMGWGVLTDKNGELSLLAHTGSNGYWVADIRILPKQQTILLVVTNAGGATAEKSVREIGKALTDRVLP